MEKQIEELRYDDNGYKSLVFFENWRVAFMNDGPATTVENIESFQKHNETDEVFVLLEGRCVLLLAGYGNSPGEITAVEMKPGTMYNVKKEVWHSHIFFDNTKVVIVENADTVLENSPKSKITPKQREIIAKLCK